MYILECFYVEKRQKILHLAANFHVQIIEAYYHVLGSLSVVSLILQLDAFSLLP